MIFLDNRWVKTISINNYLLDNNISRCEVSSHASDAQGEDDMNVENIPAGDNKL